MTAFERYGPAIAFFMFCLGMQASAFTVELGLRGSPITPELYGRAAYEIPAVAWMKAQEIPSMLGVLGAVLSQSDRAAHRRTGALLAGLAATALTCLFGIFVLFARSAEQGAHVFYLCLFVGLPLTFLCAVTAGRHFFWGEDA